MKKRIKAIIFDFGGVLVDWHPYNLYNAYFPEQPDEMDAFLQEIDFYAWNAEQDKGRSFAEGVAVLSAKFPHRAELIKAYADHWINSIRGEIGGTVSILRALKGKYHLYGLSNWSAETFPLVRDAFGFLDALDFVVLSGEVNMIKPEPEIFYYLLARIPENAGECLFIDDSRKNIEAAEKLGFHVHHFLSAEGLAQQLNEFGLL